MMFRTLDQWECEANEHLLIYIRCRLGADSRAYGAFASGVQRVATEILVAYKHGWAIDMHEGRGMDADTGEIGSYSRAEQRKAWEDCMQAAEAEIAALARKAAA